MKSKELFRLNIGLQSLAIFRNLLKDPVIAALREYLESVLPENLEELTQKAGVLRGTMPSQEYAKQVKQWLKQSVAEKEKG